MPKMFKQGSMPINVHQSQIVNAQVRGWSLEKEAKKNIKSKGVKENGNI
jgi:hypothetical protein